MIAVYKLPLRDLIIRQFDLIRKIDLSPISDLGLALGVGKNFFASSHVDRDMGFTFS